MAMIQDRQIDFKGQDFYIGMDVHKKSWTVAIRNSGLLLNSFSIDPSAIKLKQYLDKHYPGGTFHAVYEVGFCGFWICRAFRRMGIDCIVVHPPDIPPLIKKRTGKPIRWTPASQACFFRLKAPNWNLLRLLMSYQSVCLVKTMMPTA